MVQVTDEIKNYSYLDYKIQVGKWQKKAKTGVYSPCIHCKSKLVHVYYVSSSTIYRTCDVCYKIDKIKTRY